MEIPRNSNQEFCVIESDGLYFETRKTLITNPNWVDQLIKDGNFSF